MDGSPCAGTAEPVDGLTVSAAAFLPQLLSLIAMLAGAMAVGCGAVLVLRRFAGAIAAPPGPEAVLAVCGTGLLLVAAGDMATRSTTARTAGPAMSWLPAVLTRLGLLMAVAAVCLPPRITSTVDALTTIAAFVVSLVAVGLGPVADRVRSGLILGRRAAAHRRPLVPTASVPTTITPPSVAVPMAVPSLPMPQPMPQPAFQEGATATPAGSLLQRFERIVLPGGAECVRGRLCVAVPKGARSGYGHVGFCPPLASQPTVDVTTDYDGVEAVVSAAEVLPWGVRIECRLDEPAEETIEIPVDILATAPA
jgi:hypothetical protein